MRPLRTYDDWKYCIVELCQINLSKDYVIRRLEELRDESHYNTRKFVGSWGEDHRKQAIAWFEQAQQELAGSNQ